MNPFRSIAFKLSLLSSLMVLGVIGLMSRRITEQAEDNLVAQMRVRAQDFARYVLPSVFPRVDPFALHSRVAEAKNAEGVTYVAVTDKDGRVLSHSDARLIGDTPSDPVSVRARTADGELLQRFTDRSGQEAFDLAMPILVESQATRSAARAGSSPEGDRPRRDSGIAGAAGARRVGTVRLGFDRSSIEAALRRTKEQVLAIAAAAILVAILGTVLIVGWITRPLPLLAAAVRRVGRGDFDVRVESRSRDEVGVLARAFNEMAVANSILFTSLREEKQKLETLFLNTGEGIVWTGDTGKVLFMNPSARRLLGIPEDEPEEFGAALAGFSAKPALAEVLASPERVTPCEFSRKEPKLYILSGIAERLGITGQPMSFLFVFHDATLEKREETLARDFLSLVSHKLRTPLMVALGYLELLGQESKGWSDFQRQSLATVETKDRELKRLVDKLIMFTTVQSPETLVLQKEEVRPEEIVNQALKSADAALSADGVKLQWDPKTFERLPKVALDARLAAAAVENLVENAVKFNPGKSKEVRIGGDLEDGALRLSVADNGPGIPMEEHPKLFRKFYQLDPDFTGQVPGFGLGLAFVKNVVQAHGGTVGVRSSPGKGSEFHLILPAAVAPPPEPAAVPVKKKTKL